MTYRQVTLSGRSVFAASAILFLFAFGPAWSARAQEAAPAADQFGVEVQARGPIHEAFADASVGVATPGPVVSKQPPEPINEVPPDVRPDDERAVWIPGYWAWDDERNDFLWVSGVWRVPPPDTVWVPGYWTQVDGGFQWVSGFWADSDLNAVQYLPPPPDQIAESGPSSPAPGDNYFYIPGNWMYSNNQYAWQPGYWSPYQNGWTWSNSYYRWTPSGYVYVPGRWDVPFSSRGWAFAPVMFQSGVWNQPGFSYRPSTALNVLSLASMLFGRSNGWYYYGDYYGNNYARLGYQPWYAYGGRGGAYNNMYGYERWSRQRNNPNWDREMRERFAENQNNPQSRPPRSWNEWQERMRDRDRDQNNRPNAQGQANVAVRSDAPFVRLDQNANVQIGGRNGVKIDQTAKAQADQMSKHYRELRDQRRQTELQARANVQDGNQPNTQPGNRTQAQGQGGFQLTRPPVEHRVARPIEGTPQNQNPSQQLQRPQLPSRPQGNQGEERRNTLPGRPNDGRQGENRQGESRPQLPDRTLDIPRVKTSDQQPGQGTKQNPDRRPEPMPKVERPQTQPKEVQSPRQQPQPKQARPEGGNRPPKVDLPKFGGGDKPQGQGGGKRDGGGEGGKKEGGGGDKKKK